MGKLGKYTEIVRKFVVDEFTDVDTFKTRDVVEALRSRAENLGLDPEETESNYVSSALTGWALHNLIVGGYRLRNIAPPRSNKVWELVNARMKQLPPAETERPKVPTEQVEPTASAKTTKSKSERFTGKVVATEDNVLLVATQDGKLYRVMPFKL